MALSQYRGLCYYQISEAPKVFYIDLCGIFKFRKNSVLSLEFESFSTVTEYFSEKLMF